MPIFFVIFVYYAFAIMLILYIYIFSGFLGAGQTYNRSSAIVLSQIYQTIIIVISLTYSIIVTSALAR